MRRVLAAVLFCLFLMLSACSESKPMKPGVEETFTEYSDMKLELTEIGDNYIKYRVIHGKEHGQTAGIGQAFPQLEIYMDNWFAMNYIQDPGSLDMMIPMEPEQTREFIFEYEFCYGKLSPGRYRMVLPAWTGERIKFYLAGEFIVE